MDKIEIPDHEIKNILTIFPQGIVVFDLETTGLSALSDTIIEIGAIKVTSEGKTDSFQTLVNPQRPIPPHTTDIHHITDEMVKTAPILDKVLGPFLSFIDGYPLMAYNARFDIGFVLNALHRGEFPFPECRVYDCWNLAKQVIARKETENYKLMTLAKKLPMPLHDEHRAYDDAVVCLKLLAYLLETALKRISLENIEQTMHVFNVGAFMERLDFSIPEHIRPFIDLFAKQETIEMIYRGGSFKKSYRPVRPIGLVPLPQGIVLYGVCLLTQMNKSFYVKKIEAIRRPPPENKEKWEKLLREARL